ncbi:MAG TPA: PEGA domain-containing protein [Terriglobales bacterium]|nr:PEGA domain-containing protein [Terriglobales bacterium]
MSNQIGRFEILSEIAHCDASSVYKASDTEGKQTVALKVIRLEPLGEQKPVLLKSILEEAEASKVLNSHNIALLYGAGEIDGNLCASMEYVQGNSVAIMLARKEGFSIWDLQDIARQACQGLDHAHVRKVFHYGLEPAKIMVQWDGIVKILGFGVSSTGHYAAQASGKPPQLLHYMSPEQVKGDPVDARSNVFSLGAILYEMVTERKAFDGEAADHVRQAILEAAPVSVSQINRKIHPALNAVIMKALAKAPEERYQSGQELVNDLEKCKESPTKAAAAAKPAAAKPTARPVQAPAAQAALSRAAAASRSGSASPTSPRTPAAAPSGTFSAEATTSIEPASMSAPVSDEPEVQTPRIAVDPMMDESRQAGATGPSFSDINELPPLKEVYVAPVPPAAQEPDPEPAAPIKAVVFNKAAATKPKVHASEVAKKAVGEIKQTPPQLFLYSIAAAAALILLVVAGIAYHIHAGESDDDSAPTQQATAPAAAAPTSQPAQSAEPQAAPTPADVPPQITPAPPVEQVPAVSVTSRHESNKKKNRMSKPAAPNIVPGQLSIDSSPQGAQIAIDGRTTASATPFNIATLLPGHHTVTISKPGYATETRSLDVTSGSKSVISVQLAPTTAAVAANSDPAGAEVWIDGRDSGRTTPVQISVDKPGNHTFVFKKQGYLDETASANVQVGQTLQLAPTLRPLGVTDEIKVGGKFKKVFGGSETAGMGTVSVKTQPKGAQVAVNSRIVDKPSPVEFYLNPGNYIIDITMSGFKDVHKVITVEKNGKVVIDESMDRD